MTGGNGNGHNQRLDSWKEIAAYLRRDERTAIRWENRGLPVRRVPGGKRQAVFAFTAELDAWLTQEEPQGLKPASTKPSSGTSELVPFPAPEGQGLKPIEKSRLGGTDEGVSFPVAAEIGMTGNTRGRLVWMSAVVAIAVFVVVISIGVFGHRAHAASALPARVGFTLNSAEAFDNENRLLWTHPFVNNIDSDESLDFSPRIGDFRGDGSRQVLIPIRFANTDNTYPEQSEVDLFSSQGSPIWSYVPKEIFQFGKHRMDPFWVVSHMYVSPAETGNRIWVSFIHGVWGNSFVVNLDPSTGTGKIRFVNTGALRALGEVRLDKTYLLAGGFNNESDTGSLAIMDESRPFAASPQTPGTRHECVSCPAGAPDHYFEFPRSEINEIEGIHEDGVAAFHIDGNQIEAIKGVRPSITRVHYLIRADEDFRVVGIRFNSTYDSEHRRYEKEGKLHHTLENCPERLHPKPVRMWTPAGGWTEIQIEPTPYNQ